MQHAPSQGNPVSPLRPGPFKQQKTTIISILDSAILAKLGLKKFERYFLRSINKEQLIEIGICPLYQLLLLTNDL